jgi:hypothetical protein
MNDRTSASGLKTPYSPYFICTTAAFCAPVSKPGFSTVNLPVSLDDGGRRRTPPRSLSFIQHIFLQHISIHTTYRIRYSNSSSSSRFSPAGVTLLPARPFSSSRRVLQSDCCSRRGARPSHRPCHSSASVEEPCHHHHHQHHHRRRRHRPMRRRRTSTARSSTRPSRSARSG